VDAGDVVAIYDLPKHIWVTPDVLDTRLGTGAGPLHFDVLTPVPVAGDPLLDITLSPSLPGVPSDNEKLADKPWVTEYATEDDERSIALTRVAFVASPSANRDLPTHRLEKGDRRAGLAYTLLDRIDDWFDALRSWIEVLTQQDLNHRHPSYDVQFPAEGLFLWSDDQFKAPGQIKLNWPQFRPLSMPLWAWALEQVAADRRPATEHLLMRDARAALARTDTRRAVLDAATAVEVVLSNELGRALDSLARPSKTALLGEMRTLGRLADLVPSLRPDLAATKAELQKVTSARNATTHRGETPTPTDVAEVLKISHKLVTEHSDLGMPSH